MRNLSAVADSMAQLNRDMVPGVLRERNDNTDAELARDGLLKKISTEWQQEPANAWVAVRAGCNQAAAGVVKQGRRRDEDENAGRSKSAWQPETRPCENFFVRGVLRRKESRADLFFRLFLRRWEAGCEISRDA